MPQLDKVTFLSQYFWLCFFYLGFYLLVLKYFLPKMSRILKLRKKKMSDSQEGITPLIQENEKIRYNFDSILSKGVYTSRTFFHENIQQTSQWLDKIITNTNQTHSLQLNTFYLESVGETSFSQNLALSLSSKDIPEKLFTVILLAKIKKKPKLTVAQKKMNSKKDKVIEKQKKSKLSTF